MDENLKIIILLLLALFVIGTIMTTTYHDELVKLNSESQGWTEFPCPEEEKEASGCYIKVYDIQRGDGG